MEKQDQETEHDHRPMNAWEALAKIAGDLLFAICWVAVIGVIYLLMR